MIDKDEAKEFRVTLAHILEDEIGIKFFRWLMIELGYQSASIYLNENTGEVDLVRCAILNSRRNLWLYLRNFITPVKLSLIENLKTKDKDSNGLDKSKRKRGMTWKEAQKLRQWAQLPQAEWVQEQQQQNPQ